MINSASKPAQEMLVFQAEKKDTRCKFGFTQSILDMVKNEVKYKRPFLFLISLKDN